MAQLFTIHEHDRQAGGAFTAHNYFFGWSGGEPNVGVGEAVLTYKTVAQSWVRNFTVGP